MKTIEQAEDEARRDNPALDEALKKQVNMLKNMLGHRLISLGDLRMK